MVSVRISALGTDNQSTPKVYVATQCLITYWLQFTTRLGGKNCYCYKQTAVRFNVQFMHSYFLSEQIYCSWKSATWKVQKIEFLRAVSQFFLKLSKLLFCRIVSYINRITSTSVLRHFRPLTVDQNVADDDRNVAGQKGPNWQVISTTAVVAWQSL